MIDLVVEQRPSRLAWSAVTMAWGLTVVVLAVWLLGTSTGVLSEQLKVLQFWSLELCVFVTALAGLGIYRGVLRQLETSDFRRLATLGVVALGLTLFVAPRTNRIFYDEQIYQSVGQNLADLRLGQVCNEGGVEYGRLECRSGEYNKQPYGYPHALSVAYRLFGAREGIAHAMNAAAMTASVLAVYLLTLLLFRDRDAALFAGLLLALTPHQIIWSATAAVEPTASLAIVLALTCAAYCRRSGGIAALVAVAVSTAYAIQFRPESLLVLPVIGLLIWPQVRVELKQPRAWWAGLLFLVLASVHFAHLFAVRNMDWGASAARFSLGYVAGNLQVNGWFYLHDERFPVLFTLLALAGLTYPAFRTERLSMGVYFGLYFAIDLVFYAGSYNYGADVRYSVLTYPPIAVLGGAGAARLIRVIAKPGTPVRAALLTGFLFVFLWYAPVVRATTEEAWAARADVRFARSFAAGLPPNSYVLTHNPGMFQIWGGNAGQLPLIITNPTYVSFLSSRYAGGVYIHWNFWCNVQDPVHPEVCRKALALRPSELVAEYRERDQRFALYRIAGQPSK